MPPSRAVIAVLGCAWLLFASPAARAADRPPNIVFILADDLGYGDLGCYGQTRIRTPQLDRLAADGLRFRQFYAGSTVCAPSRCCLMTGLHTGHCLIRGNDRVPLRPGDRTVAEVLKGAGYATALIGKWGLGDDGSTGTPNRKGFDYFYGYLDQLHAHNYYPDHLWRDGEKVRLPGNVVKGGVASVRAQYSHDLFTREALAFVTANRERPFFLFLAYTIPHANNERGRAEGNGMEVPDDAPYSGEPWPPAQRNYAAMVSRLDADVGRLLLRVRELGLDRQTVVFFSSDNGPHKEGGADPAFFRSAGPLRGYKRSLTEGGIRVPLIVRWAGRVRAGAVTDQPGAFWDVLPTAAELAGAAAPPGLDGVSLVPTLEGRVQRQAHEFLYWEFHEGGSKQAVRRGDWKAIRPAVGAPLQLYDLKTDVAEGRDVSTGHPEVVARIEAYLKTARTPSERWPLRLP